MTPTHLEAARETCGNIAGNIAKIMRGQVGPTRQLLAALAGGGHVLLDDFPGTGKTTLAKALARSIDAKFKRIQFAPDLLPSDILGVSVFSQRDQQFHFHEGPVVTNIRLAADSPAGGVVISNHLPARTQTPVTNQGREIRRGNFLAGA